MTLETPEIRQFGIPLRDAITRFASEDLLGELEAINRLPEQPQIDPDKPVMSLLAVAAFGFQTHTHFKTLPDRIQRLQDEMREHIRFWLDTGELVGFGMKVTPKQVRVHRKIPRDFWRNAEIDWDREFASNGESSFRELLVIDTQDFPERVFFPNYGPRYFGKEIREAIRALDQLHKGFREPPWTHKLRAIEVVHWINAEYREIKTGGRGFMTDTIRRHYQRHCLSVPDNR